MKGKKYDISEVHPIAVKVVEDFVENLLSELPAPSGPEAQRVLSDTMEVIARLSLAILMDIGDTISPEDIVKEAERMNHRDSIAKFRESVSLVCSGLEKAFGFAGTTIRQSKQ